MTTLYITNHNYAPYLEQSIKSALSQTCKDMEVLIIDDGSTDGSREIIEKYRHKDAVRVFYNENKGLIQTANFALAQAKGEFIMRLDADDWLEAHAVKMMSTYLNYNKDIAAVFPAYHLCDAAGKTTKTIRRSERVIFLDPNDKEPHGACTLIRTNTLREIGGYTESIDCQDGYDFWLKVRNTYKVAALPEVLFHYRQHGKNLTMDLKRIEEARGELE